MAAAAPAPYLGRTMRDILNDLEAGKYLSDPDPVRRDQIQMKTPQPKRFY